MKQTLSFLCLFISVLVQAEDTADIQHFAFANYLGSGIYSSTGDSAAVINVPLSFTIEKSDDSELLLRMPLSLGFFNYQWDDLPEGELPDNVGTLTLTPGIEYHWQATDKLAMEAYLDIGFGHNFADSTNVGILSAGVSALYGFGSEDYRPLWVTRFYSAGYRSMAGDAQERYSALTSGVDSGLGLGFSALDVWMEPRFFGALHWVFGRGELADELVGALMDDSTLELGLSLAFDKPLGIKPITIERVGLSYSLLGSEGVWRLFFSQPL
ncbi:hypothetical protein [Shewanella sp.]|uniref:hypothetical protein n=1 Tax=Shewanella sp. TaxID=50422 RepID=UPI003563AA14